MEKNWSNIKSNNNGTKQREKKQKKSKHIGIQNKFIQNKCEKFIY